MRYLLDELHAQENDHSDALAPTSQEAEQSSAEAAVARSATTEGLQVAHHTALTADMRVLQASVDRISDDIRGLREQFGDMANRPLSNRVCPGTQQWPSNPSLPSAQSGNAGVCPHQMGFSCSGLTDPSPHCSAPATCIHAAAVCGCTQLRPVNASSHVSPAILPCQPGEPTLSALFPSSRTALSTVTTPAVIALAVGFGRTERCCHLANDPSSYEEREGRVSCNARGRSVYPQHTHPARGWGDNRAKVGVLAGDHASLEGGRTTAWPPHSSEGLAS